MKLGKKLGESEPKIEFPIQQGRYRFDVVWPIAKIAWEVDLTGQPREEQLKRRDVRRAAGFYMISLTHRRLRALPALEVPTIALPRLNDAETEGGLLLPDCYVTNTYKWKHAEPLRPWSYVSGLRFEDHAAGIVAGKTVYSQRPLFGKVFAWVNAGVEEQIDRLQKLNKRKNSYAGKIVPLSERLAATDRRLCKLNQMTNTVQTMPSTPAGRQALLSSLEGTELNRAARDWFKNATTTDSVEHPKGVLQRFRRRVLGLTKRETARLSQCRRETEEAWTRLRQEHHRLLQETEKQRDQYGASLRDLKAAHVDARQKVKRAVRRIELAQAGT